MQDVAADRSEVCILLHDMPLRDRRDRSLIERRGWAPTAAMRFTAFANRCVQLPGSLSATAAWP